MDLGMSHSALLRDLYSKHQKSCKLSNTGVGLFRICLHSHDLSCTVGAGSILSTA